MDNQTKIGDRLTELMFEKGIDNYEFAKKINVDVTTVRRWKRNAKYMFLSQLIKIANYFNCSLDFIVGRSETVIDFTPKECPQFYPQLKNILESRGISRNKVNKETKIKSSHFVEWNKGADPHILSLIELANYLDITLDSLVGRESI